MTKAGKNGEKMIVCKEKDLQIVYQPLSISYTS